MNYLENFISNKLFFKIDSSKSKLESCIGIAENLKRIHQLIVHNYGCFDDLMEAYLKVGVDIFQMDIGIVSQISKNGERFSYRVCDIFSRGKIELAKGAILPLGQTYCEEVFAKRKILCFSHVGKNEVMKGHPCYIESKLESYISAPIWLGSDIFGTLNFSSSTSRESGFSEHESDLIAIMANSISFFLRYKENEDRLRKNNKKLLDFTAHLSHDLRGPLSVIIGGSELLIDSLEDQNKEVDLKKIEKLGKMIYKVGGQTLKLVEVILNSVALSTGKMKLVKELLLVAPSWQEVQKRYQGIIDRGKLNFKISIESGLEVLVDPSLLRQVFDNLISNVLKYTPVGGEVVLFAGRHADRPWVEFILTNGLKECPDVSEEDNRDYQTFKSSSPHLFKSTGYGVQLVREIIECHGHHFSAKSLENKFEVRFYLSSS